MYDAVKNVSSTMGQAAVTALELWGGHECTVNRVGDIWRDQTVLTGHHDREDDIEAFVALGFKRLRYPLLWERVAPERQDLCDWSWTDRRLARLRSLGIGVVAGLVHHGAGPHYASLETDDFAPGLARHAAAAASRYPWVRDWTPVNEPLTTARFSGLYGHWHPHRADEGTFWRILLNEIDATRAAMRAIRCIVPDARLVQTEDLGRTYAPAALASQADHENTRRWMTWDLLFGRVDPLHPLWKRIAAFGLADRLARIADDPCPPDVVGVNHYLTSDRLLDHRLSRYPAHTHGGNGEQRYADVEAVRAVTPAPAGLEGALREAWARYRTPVAVTEVHNACTRDEQIRWTEEAWRTAGALRKEGVDIVAVTAWSLVGACDWNSLLTRADGRYEPGAFDVSSGARRPTALASHLAAIARDAEAASPVEGEGWWRRDVRLEYPPVRAGESRRSVARRSATRPAPILVVGGSGTLGQALARACAWRDLQHVVTHRQQIALCRPHTIDAALNRLKPRAVINAAGWVRVDEAEETPEACLRDNRDGAAALAQACAERGIPLATFSTDLVFDGGLRRPYLEGDAVSPLNVYGASKAEAETLVLAAHPGALILRTAAFFSPHDPHNFAAWVARQLSARLSAPCADDVTISPTYVPSLADATLDLLLDGETGIWHLANDGAMTWAEFAQGVARAARLDRRLVREVPSAELGWRARRPSWSALGSRKGRLLVSVEVDIARFAAALSTSRQWRGAGT